jgi:hypothetical protein
VLEIECRGGESYCESATPENAPTLPPAMKPTRANIDASRAMLLAIQRTNGIVRIFWLALKVRRASTRARINTVRSTVLVVTAAAVLLGKNAVAWSVCPCPKLENYANAADRECVYTFLTFLT